MNRRRERFRAVPSDKNTGIWSARTVILAAVLLAVVAALASGCGGRKRVSVDSGGGVLPAQVPGGPVLVRVGLAEEQLEVGLRATGPCYVLADRERRRVGRSDGHTPITARRTATGVSWSVGGDQGRAATIVVQPIDPASCVIWEDQQYRGELFLFPTVDGAGLTVANLVELEAYLCGVVPWEIGRPQRDALAALEAQAIAARTYTISHLGARQQRGFDVWASVMDQVYRGSADEHALCNEAIANTSGLVLRHGGDEIEAYYCSTCGGTTSTVEEVWPRAARPYLRSRTDARNGTRFCAGSKYYDWRVSWSRQQLEQILARTLPEYLDYMSNDARAAWAGTLFTPARGAVDRRRPGSLRDLTIVQRTTSGRIGRLDITTDAGTYHVRGDRVRWVLPPADANPVILRSALFDVELDLADGRPARVTASGHGFGHGVGMCQVGALAMARQGYSSVQILEHYYAGAVLEPVDLR